MIVDRDHMCGCMYALLVDESLYLSRTLSGAYVIFRDYQTSYVYFHIKPLTHNYYQMIKVNISRLITNANKCPYIILLTTITDLFSISGV